MARVIYKNQINEFVHSLSKWGRVVAPVEVNHHSGFSKVVFAEPKKDSQIVLGYADTVLPPKEFLLPPEEAIFEFEGDKITQPKPGKVIIFGTSVDDLEGIGKLRKIFENPISDKTFNNRSARVAVIAADRFSPPKNISFDVYLQKVESEKFVAFAGSSLGQKMIDSNYFKTEKVSVPKVVKRDDALLSDKNLSRAVERSQNSPVWDELAEKCFACGICSFTCPLCYCFETEDRSELPQTDTPKGKRVRSWSTCFSEDFAETAGHNFRAERKERIYNWYYHKFVRMPAEHGFSGCVDCNRCIVFCPAKINYRVVLNQLLKEDSQKRHK